ncbi:hypothetical protein ACWD5R_41100 [Streptomyces sp. NPDC002514]|uniref:hypothetical protein n=1 Tax=Streptomyces sp. NPDC001270 TaxID=3364554 RepID=UPI00367F1268
MALLYNLGLSIARVGWLCGYRYGTARKTLLDAGVQLRGPGGSKQIDVPRLVRLYESNLSIEAVGQLYGISFGTARDRLLDAGVTLRPVGVNVTRRSVPAFASPANPLPGNAVTLLHRQGYKNHHIIQLTGRSTEFVHRQLTAAGLNARVTADRLNINTEQLIAVYRCTASSVVTGAVLRVSADTVLARLREEGVKLLDAPAPDAVPVRLPEQMPWQYRDQEILAHAAQGKSAAQIAAAVEAPAAEILDVIRVYRHRDRVTAEVLRRRDQGESAGVIAVRMGLRVDRVRSLLSRYATRKSSRVNHSSAAHGAR